MFFIKLLLIGLEISLVIRQFIQLNVVSLHESHNFAKKQAMAAARNKNKHDLWFLVISIFENNKRVSSTDSKYKSLKDVLLFGRTDSSQEA